MKRQTFTLSHPDLIHLWISPKFNGVDVRNAIANHCDVRIEPASSVVDCCDLDLQRRCFRCELLLQVPTKKSDESGDTEVRNRKLAIVVTEGEWARQRVDVIILHSHQGKQLLATSEDEHAVRPMKRQSLKFSQLLVKDADDSVYQIASRRREEPINFDVLSDDQHQLFCRHVLATRFPQWSRISDFTSFKRRLGSFFEKLFKELGQLELKQSSICFSVDDFCLLRGFECALTPLIVESLHRSLKTGQETVSSLEQICLTSQNRKLVQALRLQLAKRGTVEVLPYQETFSSLMLPVTLVGVDQPNISDRPAASATSKIVIRLLNDVTVTVAKGSIAAASASVLVNVVEVGSWSLCGASAASIGIFTQAGNLFKLYCRRQHPTGFPTATEVVETQSAGYGSLKCETVYHIALNRYQNRTTDAKHLKQKVMACFAFASKSKKSIALPMVGCEDLGYPPAVVAEVMFEACLEWSGLAPALLKDITIMIDPRDCQSWADFNTEIQLRQQISRIPVQYLHDDSKSTAPKSSTAIAFSSGKIQLGRLSISLEAIPSTDSLSVLLVSLPASNHGDFSTDFVSALTDGLRKAEVLKLDQIGIAFYAYDTSSVFCYSPASFVDMLFAACLAFQRQSLAHDHLKTVRPFFQCQTFMHDFMFRFLELVSFSCSMKHPDSWLTRSEEVLLAHNAKLAKAFGDASTTVSLVAQQQLYCEKFKQPSLDSSCGSGDFVLVGTPAAVDRATSVLRQVNECCVPSENRGVKPNKQMFYDRLERAHNHVLLKFRNGLIVRKDGKTAEELALLLSDAISHQSSTLDIVASAAVKQHQAVWYVQGADLEWQKLAAAIGDWFEVRFYAGLPLAKINNRHQAAVATPANSDTAIEINFRDFGISVGKSKYGLRRKTDNIPVNWLSSIDSATHQRVTLSAASKEYRHIIDAIGDRCSKGILKIERIENVILYTQYLGQKSKAAKSCPPGHAIEAGLFHGASRRQIEGICETGFDRSRAGDSVGRMFGAGSYFSTNFACSASKTYAKDGCVLYCKVLVGESVQGYPELKHLPQKPHNSVFKYESAVDSLSNPSIFVIFADCSAYPSYLITITN